MAVNLAIGLSSGLRAPISFGDVVQVDADIGEVRRIGIRACVIRTVDGSEVIVPNGTIISNKVTNWTFSDRYRSVEVSVRVARGVAPLRVVEVLKSVATNHPSVAKEPAVGVVRELALAWKYRSHALAPRLLDCCKNAHLVIHHHIVCRRILPLDIGERCSSEIR